MDDPSQVLRRIIEEAVRYCIRNSQLGRRGMRTALPSRVADEVEEQLRRSHIAVTLNGSRLATGEDDDDD